MSSADNLCKQLFDSLRPINNLSVKQGQVESTQEDLSLFNWNLNQY